MFFICIRGNLKFLIKVVVLITYLEMKEIDVDHLSFYDFNTYLSCIMGNHQFVQNYHMDIFSKLLSIWNKHYSTSSDYFNFIIF